MVYKFCQSFSHFTKGAWAVSVLGILFLTAACSQKSNLGGALASASNSSSSITPPPTSASPTPAPTSNPSPVNSPSPTPSVTPSATPTPKPSVTPTPSATPKPSVSPSASPSPVNGAWSNVTLPSGVSIVSAVASVPGQNKIVLVTGIDNAAGVWFAQVSAYSSTDGGQSWTLLGQGPNSTPLGVQALGIQFDPNDANTFWVYGSYPMSNGGFYKYTPQNAKGTGDVFTAITGISGLQTADPEGLSVYDSPTVGQILLFGQHEGSQSVYESVGGSSYVNIGASSGSGGCSVCTGIYTTSKAVPAYTEYPYIIDENTFLMGASFASHGPWDTGNSNTGIFRTVNGGHSWTEAYASSTYEVVGSPLLLNGILYWPYYDTTNTANGLLSSSNSGASWSPTSSAPKTSLNFWVRPIALGNGQLVSLDTSNNLVASSNQGGSWSVISSKPTTAFSFNSGNPSYLVYNPTLKTYFSWTLNGTVLQSLKSN